MAKTIDKKITSYKVKTEAPEPVAQAAVPIPAPETLTRPEVLTGVTYKIKPGDYGVYITINDTVVDGKRRPYEVFINTKDTIHFQWMLIFTRLVSAVLRKGGEYKFIIEEMRSVIDPGGGYWAKIDGKSQNLGSLVAHIGMIIEKHVLECEKALDTSETTH